MNTVPTIHVFSGKERYTEGVAIHDSHALDLTGRIALKLVEHFGVIAAVPAGEDSSGRAKADLMPSDIVVARACDIAARFVAEAQARGWLHALPHPSDDTDDTAAPR